MPPKCKTQLTRSYGFPGGDVRGEKLLGFRVFCPVCGYLGKTKGWEQARLEAREHRNKVAA